MRRALLIAIAALSGILLFMLGDLARMHSSRLCDFNSETGAACVRAWLGVLAVIAAPVIGGLTVWVLVRQAGLMAGQRDLMERLRREGLVKELSQKLTDVQSDSGALLMILNAIGAARASEDWPTIEVLLEQLRVSPALRFVHGNGNAKTQRALNKLLVYLQRKATEPVMQEFDARLAALHALIIDDSFVARAGWEDAYERMIGAPIGRKERDALANFRRGVPIRTPPSNRYG